MGKKGGGGSRGFMKAAKRAAATAPNEYAESAPAEPLAEKPVDEEEGFDDEENPFLKGPSAPVKVAPVTEPVASNEQVAKGPGGDSNADSKPVESRGHMLQRHKKELRELREGFKKAGKQEKGEKKRLETTLEAEMLERQLREIQIKDGVCVEETSDTDEPASVSNTAPPEEKDEPEVSGPRGKQTKAQKRREKQVQKESEREAAILAEVENMGETDRMAEEKVLESILKPLGFMIHDIVPDGHCLYRSLAHQCQLKGLDSLIDSKDPGTAYQVLRKNAADYIRSHSENFLPFIVDDSETPPAEQLELYCDNVANTATWGSQVELQALAAALGIHIQVFNAAMPVVEMGESFKGDEKPSLQVCYQAHAYGSGEHYNSIVPLRIISSDTAEDL